MKFFILLFFPLLTQATYLVGYGTGAYMGRHQLQGEWISEDQKNRAQLIFGYTEDPEIGAIKQMGGAYLWNYGQQKEFDNFKWIPLLAGGFLTYTDHIKYYLNAPSKYNDPDYYDTTGLRFGFRFSSELIFIRKSQKTFRLSLEGNLLERAIIAYFNNYTEPGIFQAFWGLGFSLKFDY